ncbi:NTE family protein [Poseidonocella pacifica]|uniref:NTE family protein n=1 Tax=Poseidonocella pacifica TaxID=871651 RepID=A0A1I0VMG8_9RHOB|nr:patatin-like phospholipase family protein [Poseidonocella pacifica]SFA77193.1 NTE family protein [Poseidonocella pacifica]
MVRINIGLQGGGAHGAFTWGVLDRLLREDDIEIAAITGTSAGALNAAALKSGMATGGAEGARDALDWLWDQIGRLEQLELPGWMQPFMPSLPVVSKYIEYSPAFAMADASTRMLSPYVWGPLYTNPLAQIVEQLDFGEVCGAKGPALYLSATNVRTGKIKVFKGDEIGPDALLASACLPTMFQAVEVKDPKTGIVESYWDGGYVGNPALFPLYDRELPDDVVIININPLVRDSLPVSPQEIQNRINEISFNSALLQDLRAVRFVQRLLANDAVPDGTMKNVRVHMIADDQLMNRLSVATKLVPNPIIINELKEAGQRAADRFLRAHKDDLGHRQTVDLEEMFG